MQNYTITPGFSDAERPLVATLYWEAFGAKLGKVMGPDAKALEFLTSVIDPNYALVARAETGVALGVAGFKTADGSFVGGKVTDLARSYGWLGCLWRAAVLSALERDLESDVLLMDGICVARAGRGQGIGTALLHAIKAEAARRNLRHVRLDVINTNPKARALYLREGFRPGPSEQLGPLKYIFGFDSAQRLDFTLPLP